MGKHLHKFNTYSDMEDYVLSSGFTVPFVGSCPESSGSSSNTICGYNIEADEIKSEYEYCHITPMRHGYSSPVTFSFGRDINSGLARICYYDEETEQYYAVSVVEGHDDFPISSVTTTINDCYGLSFEAGEHKIKVELRDIEYGPVLKTVSGIAITYKRESIIVMDVSDIVVGENAVIVGCFSCDTPGWDDVGQEEIPVTANLIIDGNLVVSGAPITEDNDYYVSGVPSTSGSYVFQTEEVVDVNTSGLTDWNVYYGYYFEGRISFEISGLTEGIHEIGISYNGRGDGTDNYVRAVEYATIEVGKQTISL